MEGCNLKYDEEVQKQPPKASIRSNNPTFMSPTDNMFSPCTRKLVSKRGLHHPSLISLSQRRLGNAFQNESSNQDGKENVPN